MKKIIIVCLAALLLTGCARKPISSLMPPGKEQFSGQNSGTAVDAEADTETGTEPTTENPADAENNKIYLRDPDKLSDYDKESGYFMLRGDDLYAMNTGINDEDLTDEEKDTIGYYNKDVGRVLFDKTDHDGNLPYAVALGDFPILKIKRNAQIFSYSLEHLRLTKMEFAGYTVPVTDITFSKKEHQAALWVRSDSLTENNGYLNMICRSVVGPDGKETEFTAENYPKIADLAEGETYKVICNENNYEYTFSYTADCRAYKQVSDSKLTNPTDCINVKASSKDDEGRYVFDLSSVEPGIYLIVSTSLSIGLIEIE